MNTWLASFQEESGSALHEYHMLLKGASLPLAEAACNQLGEAWWYPERPFATQGCYWQFDRGCAWLNSIVLLDERQAGLLSALRFLDEWVVTGTPDAPLVSDPAGNRWQDCRR